jgi:thiamine biosynthesis lipoprotein ApbE
MVSPLPYAVLTAAIEVAQATIGIFDPSMRGRIRQIGYDRSFEQSAEDIPAATAPSRPGGGRRGIELDPEWRQVPLPIGVGLDLGGIAKRFAVDAVPARLRKPNRQS